MKSRIIFLLILAAALAGCSSGGGDTPVVPTIPDTPAEFTARGWQFFESEHYSDALADFNSALALQSNYGQALGGKGWAELKLSAGDAGLVTSVAAFTAAMAVGEDDSYVLAGLASARLVQGGTNLPVSDSLALGVATNDPNFIFSYQTSINATDMYLIAAFATAASGDFAGALYRANLIDESGIEPDYPSTWVVSEITYNSYNAAVLARLHQLSEQYSG